MIKKFKIGTLVFDHWRISEEIFFDEMGQLYALVHDDENIQTTSQLKVVSVPRNLKDLMIIQNTVQDVAIYIESVVSFVMEEVALMTKLNGTPHVVQYFDHVRQAHPNGLGCDILVRTESLHSLEDYVLENPLTRADILRLGIEMCKALENCHRNNIIHRDIQPQHIYATSSGVFKLGDFGLPCVEACDLPSVHNSKQQLYMAPELCKGEPYDHTVDIYALALVLHQLLNKNRLPFVPENRLLLSENLRNEAKILRLGGETLPPPFFAKKGKLGKVLARAAQYKPELRYQSAQQFRGALEALVPKKEDNLPIYPYVTNFQPPQFGKTSRVRLLATWFGSL